MLTLIVQNLSKRKVAKMLKKKIIKMLKKLKKCWRNFFLLKIFWEKLHNIGEFAHLVWFVNCTKLGTALIETALTRESLYLDICTYRFFVPININLISCIVPRRVFSWFHTDTIIKTYCGIGNVNSKTGKKCNFCPFKPFFSLCRPASWPNGLSKINALRINQSY